MDQNLIQENIACDLLSVVLSLKPLQVDTNGKTLPRWWGRSAHALLLNTIRQYDPGFAEQLHADHRPPGKDMAGPALNASVRPFTVSSLLGRFPQGALEREQVYALRMTAFHPHLAALLQQAVFEGPLAAGKQIELDFLPFRIEKAYWKDSDHPWTGEQNYQDLGASLLLAKQAAAKRISLQFTSPTTFKSAGKNIPLPLPEMVFGSLLDRWNAYAPIVFPEEVRRYAAECLAVGRYKISTRPVPFKRGGMRIGFVGQVTFTSLNYDRYWMSLLGALASFAIFCGVGGGTSMGMGQCRVSYPSIREKSTG